MTNDCSLIAGRSLQDIDYNCKYQIIYDIYRHLTCVLLYS